MPSNQVAVYDSVGRLQRLLGRSGRGPGEFIAVQRLVVGPGDSLLVLDGPAQRASIFDSQDRYVRGFNMQVARITASASLWLADGTFLIGGIVGTGARIGYPLHWLAPDGGFLRSFGSYPPRHDPLYEKASDRRIASGNDTIWAARMDRYTIDVLTLDGEHLGTLARRAAWFPPRFQTGPAPWGTFIPPPLVTDISVDQQGLLWVIMVVGRPEWVPGREVEYESGRRRDYYRTIIEVIDPRQARLVARTSLGEYSHGFTERGLIYTHREDEYGDVVYDVWDVRLQVLGEDRQQRR